MSGIIKQLQGYSGSTVLLMQDRSRTFVRKVGNVTRNQERLRALSDSNIAMPKIIATGDNHYDMEYIPHDDMITWLLHNPIDQFVNWILDCIAKLKRNSVAQEWQTVYRARLAVPALAPYWPQLPFTAEELIAQLPHSIPASSYHGDLTMDNCIHGFDGRFYLIDPITSDYASWVFDLAKLMQDLECGWFIRNKDAMLQGKLWSIKSAIVAEHPISDNKNLIILMLLRVLPYTNNDQDRNFIIKEINRLCIL